MEIDIVFSERLEKITFASLLIETVKYLMFHRYQTPLPFDQLQAEDEREMKYENARRSPRNRPLPSMIKKKRQFITDVRDLVVNLYQVFVQTDVIEVLLLLGATVVSPKELYSIKFCNINKEADVAEKIKATCLLGKENGLIHRSKFADKCCRKLARLLFTNPSLDKLAELGPTSIHCLILAPRNTETSWFRPKASFKLPRKLKPCEIRICGGYVDGEVTTRKDEENATSVDSDMLWFQAPVVIKGYKEAYKETQGSSMWAK